MRKPEYKKRGYYKDKNNIGIKYVFKYMKGCKNEGIC